MKLPPAFAPLLEDDPSLAVRVLLDLTVYLEEVTVDEFDFLVKLYASVCPPERLTKFKITELFMWSDVRSPLLTDSALAANAAGIPYPYFEATRNRIRECRSFDAQFWDGRKPHRPDCTWAFSVRGIRLKESGSHAFVRFILPLTETPKLVAQIADQIARSVRFLSGHGGLFFGYDPTRTGAAFKEIFRKSKRFWGVDIEYLNLTLPCMKESLKSPNWLYMIGHRLVSDFGLQLDSELFLRQGGAAVSRENGQLVISTRTPEPIDVNRQDAIPDGYRAIADAIGPHLLQGIGSFPSDAFDEGKTDAWFARFDRSEPWRNM